MSEREDQIHTSAAYTFRPDLEAFITWNRFSFELDDETHETHLKEWAAIRRLAQLGDLTPEEFESARRTFVNEHDELFDNDSFASAIVQITEAMDTTRPRNTTGYKIG